MDIYHKLKAAINKVITNLYVGETLDLKAITVESPKDPLHGDLATNAAMVLAGQLKKSPREIASILKGALNDLGYISHIEIAGPGFINFTLKPSVWQETIDEILKLGEKYGDSSVGENKKYNVEFVSANPTGPMHIGHARGAVYGDALSRLLKKAGYQVEKEFYMNDYGGQIDVLARSAFIRYLECATGEKQNIPEGLYPGGYLIPVGEALFKKYGSSLITASEEEYLPVIKEVAIAAMMELIKQDLADLNIKHDIFFSEKSLHSSGEIEKSVAELTSKDLVYKGMLEAPKGMLPEDWEEREQILFKSTNFGDDQDRALQKSNGQWSYFAADVAYTKNKIDRGFDSLILILGADHGGYIKRLEAVAKAYNPLVKLDVKICQLVNFIKDGEPVKMSKRAGNFTTVRDVINEVGRDIIRFIMLTRKNDAVMDFDLDKVKEQSKDNPVFYVQYAHVRTKSILENAKSQLDTAYKDFENSNYDLALLESEEEMHLIKTLASWPKTVESAALHAEPHRIAFYLQNLAAEFHALWNLGKEKEYYRFIITDNEKLTSARLALAKAIQLVIRSGLGVLGVEPLDRM
ncbi:MAG: arginine--tRNA ligase [Rickettsiaceae bacterium]|jgi:arginyl-tRNA synthetase|nr:arginine--tRNA ligase [Rickettsiaceae bacterium]